MHEVCSILRRRTVGAAAQVMEKRRVLRVHGNGN